MHRVEFETCVVTVTAMLPALLVGAGGVWLLCQVPRIHPLIDVPLLVVGGLLILAATLVAWVCPLSVWYHLRGRRLQGTVNDVDLLLAVFTGMLLALLAGAGGVWLLCQVPGIHPLIDVPLLVVGGLGILVAMVAAWSCPLEVWYHVTWRRSFRDQYRRDVIKHGESEAKRIYDTKVERLWDNRYPDDDDE